MGWVYCDGKGWDAYDAMGRGGQGRDGNRWGGVERFGQAMAGRDEIAWNWMDELRRIGWGLMEYDAWDG